ncbi:multidrug resistance protein 1 [Streptococcus pneumoniae]|nr:multidrug resistance protein 1 [Streptococcus pneumoniae]
MLKLHIHFLSSFSLHLISFLYIKSQGCTQIIVAHRLSTIKDADIIVVMKGGKIVESGNHKYLMDLGGEYYSLYTKRK